MIPGGLLRGTMPHRRAGATIGGAMGLSAIEKAGQGVEKRVRLAPNARFRIAESLG